MSSRRIRAWKQNWQEKGLDGLLDAPCRGRPKKLTAAREVTLLAITEQPPSGAVTHWSTRRLARRLGVSHMTVMRVWHKAGLPPHRLRGFVARPDPQFEAKAKDILDLYLDPPKNTAVFCIDEKTAMQGLDRSQPALPLRPGQVERRAVEYVRHGTVSLFAALEVPTGKVHKTPLVRDWQKQHPNVHFHFTPTYASWLNQVEIWLGMITRDCIRRGVFHSVPDLTQNLDLHSPIQPQCSAFPLDLHQTEETHPCVTFFGYATLGSLILRRTKTASLRYSGLYHQKANLSGCSKTDSAVFMARLKPFPPGFQELLYEL